MGPGDVGQPEHAFTTFRSRPPTHGTNFQRALRATLGKVERVMVISSTWLERVQAQDEVASSNPA